MIEVKCHASFDVLTDYLHCNLRGVSGYQSSISPYRQWKTTR